MELEEGTLLIMISNHPVAAQVNRLHFFHWSSGQCGTLMNPAGRLGGPPALSTDARSTAVYRSSLLTCHIRQF